LLVCLAVVVDVVVATLFIVQNARWNDFLFGRSQNTFDLGKSRCMYLLSHGVTHRAWNFPGWIRCEDFGGIDWLSSHSGLKKRIP